MITNKQIQVSQKQGMINSNEFALR